MKKSILAIAVASLAASSAAMAADPTLYGNAHLSINSVSNDVPGADNNLNMSSNTSAIGVKGSEDLGDGWKAIYKVEFQVDIANKVQIYPDENYTNGSTAGSLSGRDQFVGLKSAFGTIKFGTMSSNYKQMGGKVDPLYRTPLEGRGFLGTQSSTLHGGKGINRGRETNTAQYVSPKIAGAYLVANTTFSGSNDETSGIGVRWSNKNMLVFADYITGQTGTAQLCGTGSSCKTEAATKIGGKFSTNMFSVALQYENAEDRTGGNYLFGAGTFNIDKNNQIMLTAGQYSGKASNTDHTGIAVAYNHKLSKMTNVYVGYGSKSDDVKYFVDGNGNSKGGDVSMITAGIKKKF